MRFVQFHDIKLVPVKGPDAFSRYAEGDAIHINADLVTAVTAFPGDGYHATIHVGGKAIDVWESVAGTLYKLQYGAKHT